MRTVISTSAEEPTAWQRQQELAAEFIYDETGLRITPEGIIQVRKIIADDRDEEIRFDFRYSEKDPRTGKYVDVVKTLLAPARVVEEWHLNRHQHSRKKFHKALREGTFKITDDTLDPRRYGTQQLDPLGGDKMTETRTWESVRLNAIKVASTTEGRREPKIQIRDTGDITCTCIIHQKHKLCPHIAAMFLQGRDRTEVLNLLDRPTRIKLPIALGKYWLPVEFQRAPDMGGPNDFFQTRCDILFPRDPYILGPGEGSLAFIKYVEDFIRGTDVYQNLMNSTGEYCVRWVTDACQRGHRHTSHNHSLNIAGFRPHNDRENFIIATALAMNISGLCSPCSNNKTGDDDIPVL